MKILLLQLLRNLPQYLEIQDKRLQELRVLQIKEKENIILGAEEKIISFIEYITNNFWFNTN